MRQERKALQDRKAHLERQDRQAELKSLWGYGRRQRPGDDAGSGDTFSSMTPSKGRQQQRRVVSMQEEVRPNGPQAEPGVASTSTNTVEQQLQTIVQAIAALQSQMSQQNTAVEQRLVAVERRQDEPRRQSMEFGRQFRGGDSDSGLCANREPNTQKK